ncbi:calmodulin-like protein 3 [Juglans microcarpa x Juglans regia]|uniref:calmodulin-like protein 3 n=1 Tax=Juglans microcarpa x Juglans regia TaxID=2249226 RepID=UPI001B7E6B90|nr:calmodulin-like protein 3 [Juglans microcarpa x Juglans regia]
MVIITLLLLAVLFVAGLVNIFFYFPTKKFYAWLQYISANKSSSPMVSTASPPPVASHKLERTTAHNKPELKKIFATFDKNGDGFIAKQELRESLKNIRIFMTDKEVEEMVVKVDANGDGLIDFDEFCVLCESMVGQEGDEAATGLEIEGGEEDLKEAFGVFDKDRDGLITVEELRLVLSSLGLKEGKKVEDCQEMIRKVDMDGDGMVNFDEFKKMMKGGGRRLLLA